MPIASSDIKYFLTGGSANAAPGASLGGVVSSVEVNPSTLLDPVDATESSAGDTEFRCISVKNTHATLTLVGATAWIPANTDSASTDINIGLGTSALSATEQTIANEGVAPSGVAFVAAASQGAGLALGDIPPGGFRNVWTRRVVQAGAGASSDTFTLRVTGATAA